MVFMVVLLFNTERPHNSSALHWVITLLRRVTPRQKHQPMEFLWPTPATGVNLFSVYDASFGNAKRVAPPCPGEGCKTRYPGEGETNGLSNYHSFHVCSAYAGETRPTFRASPRLKNRLQKNELLRAKRTCSSTQKEQAPNDEAIERGVQKVTDIFLSNGYPNRIITNHIQSKTRGTANSCKTKLKVGFGRLKEITHL